MRRSRVVFTAVVGLLALSAAACSSSDAPGDAQPTPSTDPQETTTSAVEEMIDEPGPPLALPDLEVALVWHQHQPQYPVVDGVVTRPWVRLHAAKDYVDMASLVREFRDLQLTINLTPVLLDQLEELRTGVRDSYWVAAETPIAELTDDQRAFITERFFDINPAVIDTLPRFVELRDVRAEGRAFSDAELQDLRALFHLGWIDPEIPERAPFVEKGRDFDDDDVRQILAITQDLVEATIPTHAELWENEQVEVITTPLAHPILPLIADTDLARIGDPTAELPREPFRQYLDAADHVRLGLDRAEELLGQRPTGMWPGEGAVAQPIMRLFAQNDVDWVATGEDVLAQSLDLGAWTRDANDTVAEAELLYRPWQVDTPDGPVTMFFRDNRISDLIGFEYSGQPADAAADDLIERLAAIREQLGSLEFDHQPLVSIILDGENAWENYPNDGRDFLRALYGRLSETDWLTTTTPTRYLEEHPADAGELDEVFPAAWFTPNYSIWIGESEEARAWDLLRFARQELGAAERQGTASEDQLDAAFDAMRAAQGSDWFWWYGADQDSGDDGYFDAAYRELLGQVYDRLQLERPRWVDVPIIAAPTVRPASATDDAQVIEIDGRFEDWDQANRFELDADDLSALGVAMSETELSLQIVGDLDGGAEIYLRTPRGVSRRGTTIDDRLLGFDATHLVRVDADGAACVSTTLLPVTQVGRYPAVCEPVESVRLDRAVELSLPNSALGALAAGDRVFVRALVADALHPSAGAGEVSVPDIAGFEPVVSIVDPTGDDSGAGGYTYPTDPLFTDGSYDLTGIEVGASGDDVVFSLTVDAPVSNPWNSPVGLSIQSFDIYLDVDPGTGTGNTSLLDGRNARLDDGHGWEAAVAIEGWDRAVAVPLEGGGYEETKPDIGVSVLSERGRVTVRVPRAALPEAFDPASTGIAAVVLSQEGFPSPGVRRVRDIDPTASQWRGGGAPAGDGHTRIYDAIAPDGVDQTALLSAGIVPVMTPP